MENTHTTRNTKRTGGKPTLEIHINTDNSAFGEDYLTKSQETIRILKQIIKDIDTYDVGICRDINGNIVGSWALT